MRPYRPMNFRPRSPSPLLGRHFNEVGPSPVMGQTFDEFLGLEPAMGDMIRLVVHGFSGYLGAYFGTKQKGLLSGLGWTFMFVNGLGAAMDLCSIIKRIVGTHPPAQAKTTTETREF